MNEWCRCDYYAFPHCSFVGTLNGKVEGRATEKEYPEAYTVLRRSQSTEKLTDMFTSFVAWCLQRS
jgi:hypothetical protein